ncbi:MAG: carbohydrate-binding protein, partial [Armatimonadota bacterium]
VCGIGDKFHRPLERYRLSVRGAPTYGGRVFLCPGASDGAALQALHASLPPEYASRDTDGDGVADRAELAARTNPLVADTDADGLSDGADPEPRDPDRPEPRRPAFEEVPARQTSGTSWVWVEAEHAASVNWERNVDAAKPGTTSGGKCLGGFRQAGETAAYVVDLPADLPEACLHLRFARQMSGGRLRITADEERAARGATFSLPHTGGWGTAMGHWQAAKAPIGPLTAGKHLLQLTAQGAANANLDGFYVGAADLAPSMQLNPDGALRHPDR